MLTLSSNDKTITATDFRSLCLECNTYTFHSIGSPTRSPVEPWRASSISHLTVEPHAKLFDKRYKLNGVSDYFCPIQGKSHDCLNINCYFSPGQQQPYLGRL